MTKDGSNARKKAARDLAAAEQIPYTEALRRTGQRTAGIPPAGEENIAPADAGRAARARVTVPVAALTTDMVLIGHTSRVESVAFGPDGHTLASGGDVTVRLWDLATRQTTTVLTGETDVYSVAFSPDGHTLAVAAPGPDRFAVDHRHRPGHHPGRSRRPDPGGGLQPRWPHPGQQRDAATAPRPGPGGTRQVTAPPGTAHVHHHYHHRPAVGSGHGAGHRAGLLAR